jgi:hypothetical protein
MGLSMSAHKDTYALRAAESDRKRTVTPYSFCFEFIVDWILRDFRLGAASNTEGVAFILERGHQNNPEVEQEFHAVRSLHKIEHLLHSIRFVPKESCRAIQLADLLAFYSRRDGVTQYKAREVGSESYTSDTMMKIIIENLPIAASSRPILVPPLDRRSWRETLAWALVKAFCCEASILVS